MDTTLCGDAMEGDSPELKPCETVNPQKLTCTKCIDVIRLAQSVPDYYA